MSEPEISHRCAACGASVRQSAAFCPQCGNPMTEDSAATEIGDGMPAARSRGPNVTGSAETPSVQGLETDTKAMSPKIEKSGKRSGGKPVAVGPYDRQSTSRTPRLVEQHAPGTVGKLRKVSSLVIDQAAYDPSLRFLLVAGALFLLFLVALILSKVIR